MPLTSTSIFSAAGTLGRPGIFIIVPVKATIKPAPADTVRSLIVILKPVGLPSFVWSSVSEYWFFAIQIGMLPNPSFSKSATILLAAGVNSTPSAP